MGGSSGPDMFDNFEFENMVKMYRKRLLNHIRNHIFNPEDVYDVYQETLFTAYKKWDSYIECGKRLNWLFVISNNCIHTWKRKNHPILQTEVSMEDVEAMLKDLSTVEEDQGLEEIFTRSVTPDERIALIQFYHKRRAIPEIAQELGISQDAIKKRLERGRNHLREDLRDERVKE